MARFEITAPDGGRYEVEGENEQGALAALQQHIGGTPAAPRETIPDDMSKSFARGAGRGAIGMVGAPADIAMNAQGLVDKAARWATGKNQEQLEAGRFAPGGKLISDEMLQKLKPAGSEALVKSASGALPGLNYEPQTEYGRVSESLGNNLAGAALPGSTLQRSMQVLLPTVGGEVGERMGGATGRAIGTAAGSLGPSVMGRPSYVERRLAGAARGVTPGQFDEATDLAQAGHARGVGLTGPEAITQVAPQARGLASAQRIAESSPRDNALAQLYQDRPQAMSNATDTALDQIAPRPAAPGQVGRLAQEGAEGALEHTRQQINRLAEPYYATARTVPIPPGEMAVLRALPGYDEALATVRNTPQLNRMVAGLPDDSVGVLNEVKKQLNQSSENAGSVINPHRNVQVSTGYGRDAADVTDTGRSLSRDFGDALDIQTAGRRNVLGPQQAGPLGTIATTPEIGAQGKALLGPGASPQEVRQAAGMLMGQDPAAARGIVREELGRRADRTVAGLDNTGQPDQYGGSKFARTMRADRGTDMNTSAAMEAVAGPPISEDIQRLVDVLQATGNRQRPGSMTAFNTQELENAARSPLATMAQTAITKPFAAAGEAYGRMRAGGRMDDLARVMAAPDSVRQIQAMAQQGTGAQRIIARLLLEQMAAGQGSDREPVGSAR